MSWTKRDLKRSYPCNTQLLKYLREQKNWSQRKLAEVAGYSERLIGKVESGGSVATSTIEVLAKALNSDRIPVCPEDLISDPVALAKAFTQAFHELQRDMISKIRDFVEEQAVFRILGDPDSVTSVPFAGSHQGIGEFACAINKFFDTFELVEDEDGSSRTQFQSFNYLAQGNDVIVWGEAWVQPIGTKAERLIPVTQLLRFRGGKLYHFEDRFIWSMARESNHMAPPEGEDSDNLT